VTTGALLYDITKPGGSIDWLQDNNGYYSYGGFKITPTGFSSSGNKATLEISASFDQTLYVNGKVDATQSGAKTKTSRYTLELTDSGWKIADYQ
jgi:hypothetical protein